MVVFVRVVYSCWRRCIITTTTKWTRGNILLALTKAITPEQWIHIWTTSNHLHISFYTYELIWKNAQFAGLEKSLWANLYACQGTRAVSSSAVARTLSLLVRSSLSPKFIYLFIFLHKISFHHRQTMLIKSDKNDWYCGDRKQNT